MSQYFVECLDRQSRVQHRLEVYKIPFVVGRSPECDVVLDDAHVCPQHFVIETSPAGELCVRDLGSLNGTYVAGSRTPFDTLKIAPETTLRAGQTLIRIGSRERNVPPALPYRKRGMFRTYGSMPLAALAILAVWSFLMWKWPLQIEEMGEIWLDSALLFLFLCFWIGGWSLAGLQANQNSNFPLHFNIALVAVSSFIAVVELKFYLAFGLDAPRIEWIAHIICAAIVATALYFHWGAVSRTSWKTRLAIGSLIAAIFMGWWSTMPDGEENQFAYMNHGHKIRTPAAVMVEGETPQVFLERTFGAIQKVE